MALTVRLFDTHSGARSVRVILSHKLQQFLAENATLVVLSSTPFQED